MKIALVHELLTMRGGAERVLRVLADMFPDAPIFTLLYDEKKLGRWFPKERVRTSHLQNSLTTHYSLLTTGSINHHLYLRRFPKAVEAWDFSEFDLVLSTSSAFAHGIITNGKPKHLCYVHSPARYLWDRTQDVIKSASRGIFGPLKKSYLQRTFHRLRIWDSEAADRPDMLIAASKTVERRIELYWRRKSDVMYPPIDDFWFNKRVESGKLKVESGNYLVVSSLVRYKRIDLAIAACNALKKNLVIVGEGPDKRRLQSLAGSTVTFAGYLPQEKIRDLYSSSVATIFPGDEDFGLVPLESMSCGTPVVAYRSGGALETMIEGQTGEFFGEPTSESLQSAMKILEEKRYDRELLRSHAKKFSRQEFERKIRDTVAKIAYNKT